MSPTHAPTPCLETGCGRLATIKGRCAECRLLLKVGVTGRAVYDAMRGGPRERGYDVRWEKRRRAWLELEPFCRICGQPGNQVDHVIPHRGAEWLFDLVGNLQTLCRGHHTSKTARERAIPIGMMYPLDLPTPPHHRPTHLYCGPKVDPWETPQEDVLVFTNLHAVRNEILALELGRLTPGHLTLIDPAPRTAERAFWSYVMGCTAELVEPPIEWLVDGHPKEWWDPYMLDGRAEAAMAARIG